MKMIEETVNIRKMIYRIRDKYVMLDSELSKLYKCKNGTKSINLAVKRNRDRFPDRFMFKLTDMEYEELRFQIETPNNMSRTLPYAFTEEGVAMLSSVLRTEIAVDVSIRIMDAFVAMRHYINNDEYRLLNIESRLIKQDNEIRDHGNRINNLEESFDKLGKAREINEIYFDGKIYDAYSKIVDIFN